MQWKKKNTSQLFERSHAHMIKFKDAQGPLLTSPEWPSEEHAPYESLSIYHLDFAENGAPTGVMPNTTAILRSKFAQGNYGLFSPHPDTKGKNSHLPSQNA
jgi:hypothetical protein